MAVYSNKNLRVVYGKKQREILTTYSINEVTYRYGRINRGIPIEMLSRLVPETAGSLNYSESDIREYIRQIEQNQYATQEDPLSLDNEP